MHSENSTDHSYLREGICKIKRPELYCEIVVVVVMVFHAMLQFHFAYIENCHKKYKGHTRQQVTFTYAIEQHAQQDYEERSHVVTLIAQVC